VTILKTTEGLIQIDRCPACGYHVFWTDMDYEDGLIPTVCRFCRGEKEDRRILKQESKAHKALEAQGLRLTTPCAFCGTPMPSLGIFGPATYTDVPENHAKDCPIGKMQE